MTNIRTKADLAGNMADFQMTRNLNTIVGAQDIDTVWHVLTRSLAAIGFDRIIYGCTHCRTESSFGDPQDMLILTNHDPAYLDNYVDEGMYFHAPMIRWAQNNTGSCSWNWISENLHRLTTPEQRVVEFNRSKGVVAGYTLSFEYSSCRTRGAMSLTAQAGLGQRLADSIWAKVGADLELMCNVAHMKILSLPHKGRRRPLTARQREVLEWVSDGKTTQDIATIMGLTAATIEKHLRLARETLDVETTTQAVMKATVQNQIFQMQA
ncbi:MAG: LuxR family transcriptional regulator [Qingshengfaniella sp.]